ncbi:MAG: hypothetical protein Q7V31_03755 [Parvibaculum sp.]|uniref:hypothetical protein n=1 Tax=Parvibaculum sp. TaxID=2024848 RepID=UPI00271D0A3D|nr:hypothetical protein [Parvibaculum sp.]MDO8838018.1 hypothetical protein [Parvibaculum sp.]
MTAFFYIMGGLLCFLGGFVFADPSRDPSYRARAMGVVILVAGAALVFLGGAR